MARPLITCSHLLPSTVAICGGLVDSALACEEPGNLLAAGRIVELGQLALGEDGAELRVELLRGDLAEGADGQARAAEGVGLAAGNSQAASLAGGERVVLEAGLNGGQDLAAPDDAAATGDDRRGRGGNVGRAGRGLGDGRGGRLTSHLSGVSARIGIFKRGCKLTVLVRV